MKTLREVLSFLDSINHINCGGCGISAYSTYLWLKKHNLIDKDFKFVLLYKAYNKDYYLNNTNVLRSKEGEAVAPSHMVIYHKGEYLDSEGVKDISDYKWIQHVTDEWFIENCLNNKSTWNDWFDRETNVPIIEKELEVDLSKFK